MINKIFIDADIIIDLLSKRDPFYSFSAELFSKIDSKEIRLILLQ
jgi:predicted nucleic acid-binding protein